MSAMAEAQVQHFIARPVLHRNTSHFVGHRRTAPVQTSPHNRHWQWISFAIDKPQADGMTMMRKHTWRPLESLAWSEQGSQRQPLWSLESP